MFQLCKRSKCRDTLLTLLKTNSTAHALALLRLLSLGQEDPSLKLTPDDSFHPHLEVVASPGDGVHVEVCTEYK